MRNKSVTIAGKTIDVQERRIGELKALVAGLVPGSGGNLANVDLGKLAEIKIDDLLYQKLPEIFPGLTPEDVDNAYLSEVEAAVETFIDVHFLGPRRLIQPLMGLARTGAQNPQATRISPPAGTTRKR